MSSGVHARESTGNPLGMFNQCRHDQYRAQDKHVHLPLILCPQLPHLTQCGCWTLLLAWLMVPSIVRLYQDHST